MTSVETTIKSSILEIARVATLVEELAFIRELPPSSVWPLNVALDEVLSNIINYGHPDGREHEIRIRLSIERGMMIAEVEDDGLPFDPLAAPAPAIDAPLEERPVGGLGIHIVRSLMHEVAYARIAGRNRLTLKRALAPQHAHSPIAVNESVTDGVTVLEIAGRIDSLTAPAFEKHLAAALESGQYRLVIDLGQLLYINSAGFRVLHQIVAEATEKNGRLVLCGMSATVSELFTIAGFGELVILASSRADGIIAASD